MKRRYYSEVRCPYCGGSVSPGHGYCEEPHCLNLKCRKIVNLPVGSVRVNLDDNNTIIKVLGEVRNDS